MRLTLILLIIIHGLIHLMGFCKAFGILDIKELSLPISKPYGIVWLLSFLFLISAAILYSVKFNYWWLFGIIGVTLSQMLIFYFWSDAKFGTVPNIVISLAVIIAFLDLNFNKKIDNEILAILSQSESTKNEIVTDQELSNLPSPVKKWLINSGIVGKERINKVWLSQKALMKMKPEQSDWYEATAKQCITVDNPAFIWTVDLEMSPIMQIKGRDKYEEGKGEMLIKMNSLINIVNEKGEKINEGTLQRFLGEIVWFPSAALSPYIKWKEIDSLTAQAVMDYKGTTGKGTFYFNTDGDFVKFSALRFKGNEADDKRFEWIISAKDYTIIYDIKIPTELEATWIMENENWTWLKLEITDIVYNLNDKKAN